MELILVELILLIQAETCPNANCYFSQMNIHMKRRISCRVIVAHVCQKKEQGSRKTGARVIFVLLGYDDHQSGRRTFGSTAKTKLLGADQMKGIKQNASGCCTSGNICTSQSGVKPVVQSLCTRRDVQQLS